MKVQDAVRGLAPEYENRIEFVVVPAEETAQRGDEIELYGFTDLKHGLVGFTSDRDPLVKLPGHRFGEPEIREACERLLSEG